ncbi:MAG: hypothetical protein HRU40_19905 [Saprospiraceae bacterium]|nr:hypothetical protein [Saprospiraceae bacterium]
MSNISDRIEQIESKIRILSQRLVDLKAENEQLKADNKRLQYENQSSKNTLEGFSTKAPQSMMPLPDSDSIQFESTNVARQQIDRYIQEIDACIEWLTKNETY